jgi:ABC-type enterobactin transport system permease subunit
MGGEWLIVGSVVSAAIVALAHWIPGVRNLHRLWRYTIGVSAILVGFAVWQLMTDGLDALIGLCMIAVAGGAATSGAYLFDWLRMMVRKAQIAEQVLGDDWAE